MFKRKLLTLATAMVMTLSIGSTVFASSLIYDPEDGIGIEVESPTTGVMARSVEQGTGVLVSGGTLWVSWKDGKVFRANYYHKTKTHRCSVTNDHLTRGRSKWTPAGKIARSPWIDQTITNNKAFAQTK